MADQSAALEYSVSFISAVETGRKRASVRYLKKLISWLGLSEEQQKELMELASAEKKIIKVIPGDRERASVANQFARLINKLPAQRLSQIRELLTVEADDAETRL
jgi:hypothetical protein